jgi:hypothetical protein
VACVGKCMRTSAMNFRRSVIGFTALLIVGACATAGGGAGATGSSTSPSSPSTGSGQTNSPLPSPASARWPVTAAAHVDLWLHAFAMISRDTARVPLYRRGYRDSISAVRSRSNVLSALDGNREKLAQGLAASPNYLQAQFLPLDFSSWEEMRQAAEQFLQFEGEPRRAPNQNTAARVAQFSSVFPSPADREWLRLFLASAQDENTRWFAAEHARIRSSRAPVVAAADSLMRTHFAKFERFLNNTSQRNGTLLLSLPIGGEGRAGTGGQRQTVIASTFPSRVQDASEALLVFAHEITGSLVGNVVTDNTTPAEVREGLSERYVSVGQVRAGAILLEKIEPTLVVPYMRYYLAQTGSPAVGDPAAAFARTFELPKAIADGLLRQIEIVLGGI